MARIVVGVDGSPGAAAALAWALAEARVRRAVLEVVLAWHYPYYGDPMGGGFPAELIADWEPSQQQLLDELVTTVVKGATDVFVRPILEFGDPADVLLRHGDGADLLVVGRRGHGGFGALLLGSVSTKVVHHAPCPVAVIPVPSAA